jgi:hypothetical protein
MPKWQADEQRQIEQWKELLRAMSNYIRDFEAALDDMRTDEDFMTAYRDLSYHCGEILDGFNLPIGGTVDDLRAAVVARGEALEAAGDD